MSTEVSKRIIRNGLDEIVAKEPQTVLEATVPPPQYGLFSWKSQSDPAPIFAEGSRAYKTPQRYPQILENPTIKECFMYGTRTADLVEWGLYGLGFTLLAMTELQLGRRVFIGNMLSVANVTLTLFPLAQWRRSYGRLTGKYENSREQEYFGMKSERVATKVVRKRVFNSLEDDPVFMDKWLDHVDNPTFNDLTVYLRNMPHIQRKMEMEGLTIEDFKSYPSEQLADPNLKALYKTVVGNTPDLQKFFLNHPEAVKILRDQPWALQEYEHGNRFLAKLYRIWSQPQVHEFLQSKPIYVSNFMYNKITWEDLLEFADDWKSGKI